MKSKYGRLFAGLLVIVAVFTFSLPSMAINDPNDYTFKGTHEYDSGSQLKVGGTWYVGGTKITASANDINNSASMLATNATQDATCSNLNVTGIAVFPAGTVNSVCLSGNVVQARITNALASAAATIGGNLAVATMTNAFAGTAYTTNTLTGDGKTNVFIWNTVGNVKMLKSITTTP